MKRYNVKETAKNVVTSLSLRDFSKRETDTAPARHILRNEVTKIRRVRNLVEEIKLHIYNSLTLTEHA